MSRRRNKADSPRVNHCRWITAAFGASDRAAKCSTYGQMASVSSPFDGVPAVEAQPPDHQFVGSGRRHQGANSLQLRRRHRRRRTAFAAMLCQRTGDAVAVGSARCVRSFETGLLGVVAHSFSIGKIDCAFEIERLAIHVRETASRARCPSAILLERQRCDITPHGVTQTLTTILPTCIFCGHLEWLRELTDSLVGIKINRHRRNIEARGVAAIDRLLL